MNSCHPASNTKGHLVPSCVIVFFLAFLLEQRLAQARFEQGVKSRDCCRIAWRICFPLQAALESRQWGSQSVTYKIRRFVSLVLNGRCFVFSCKPFVGWSSIFCSSSS